MNPIEQKTEYSNGRAGDGAAVRRARRGAVASEMDAVVNDSEELLQRVGHLGDLGIAAARDKVAASIARVREAADSGLHGLKQRGQRVAITADEYVHGRPWTAVAIAAAAGVAFGALLRRR